MISESELSTAMNNAFLNGVRYNCEELLAYMKAKKRTTAQIEKWLKEKNDEAVDTKKWLNESSKTIKKATFLK